MSEPQVAEKRQLGRELPVDLVRGFLIGTSELVPGVSGGTVALVTGVYEQLINSLRHFGSAGRRLVTGPHRVASARAEVQRVDWVLVVPVLVGMAAALLSIAGAMESFVSDSPELARGLFLGLVLVSIVVPVRMLPTSPERSRARDALLVVVVAAATFWTVGLAGNGGEADVPLYLIFLAAAVAICALVLPGVSGSFLLLTLGLYSVTLEAVDQRDLVYLLVFFAGAVAGLALFVPVLSHLLEHHRRTTLLVMVGLLVGSLRALWPWQSSTAGADGDAQGPGALLAPYDPVLGPLLMAVLGAAIVAVLIVYEARGGSHLESAEAGTPGADTDG